MAENALKVSRETKERVRLGAAILACTQGELIDRAIAEYLEHHAEDLQSRVESARRALLGTDADVIAYLLDVDSDEIARVTEP
ncbi:MAG TPA: hypothetical protein VGK68_09795 [Gaiellaceae bacterium]